MRDAIAAGFERASAGVDRVCLTLAKVALAGIVATVLVQIVARYGLRAPPAWTEELARYLMVWGGLLGATCAFRRRTDPVIFPAAETGARARLGAVLIAMSVVIFLAPILYFSVFAAGVNVERGFIARSLARTSDGLGINMALIAASVPFCAAVILFHLLARIVGPDDSAPGAGR